MNYLLRNISKDFEIYFDYPNFEKKNFHSFVEYLLKK